MNLFILLLSISILLPVQRIKSCNSGGHEEYARTRVSSAEQDGATRSLSCRLPIGGAAAAQDPVGYTLAPSKINFKVCLKCDQGHTDCVNVGEEGDRFYKENDWPLKVRKTRAVLNLAEQPSIRALIPIFPFSR